MLSSGKILSGENTFLERNCSVLLSATTCLFACYSSYTVIKFLIWGRGTGGWLQVSSYHWRQPRHVIMYSQEYASILTQHFGYAVSDYHIHNSVCMFELPLWASALHAFMGAIHMHEWRAVLLPDCYPERRDKRRDRTIKLTRSIALPHCRSLKVHNLGRRLRRKPRKDPS